MFGVCAGHVTLERVARGQTKCRLDVLGVQGVRWGKGDCTGRVYTFLWE